MLALLLASLFSWYLIAKLHMSYKKAQADDDHFQKIFWSGAELNTLYNNAQLNSKRVGLEDIFYQGLGEFLKLKNVMLLQHKPLKAQNVFYASV